MVGGIIRGSSLCWQVFLIKEDWKKTRTGAKSSTLELFAGIPRSKVKSVRSLIPQFVIHLPSLRSDKGPDLYGNLRASGEFSNKFHGGRKRGAASADQQIGQG